MRVEGSWTRTVMQDRKFDFGDGGDAQNELSEHNCDENCQAAVRQIRPRVALGGVYRAGDLITTEEVHHASECDKPAIGNMYGELQNASETTPTCKDHQGKRYKFVIGHLDLDLIMDYVWCECEESATSNRCRMEMTDPIRPFNGGTVLSFFGCQRKENQQGQGPARLQDAPMAYLDPQNDAVCSCTYPRCFDGKIVSDYEISTGQGQGLVVAGNGQKLHDWLGRDSAYVQLIQQKLKQCCQSKTAMWIDYAERICGEQALNNVCANTPNGYEPRFDNEGLGADKHFPKSPCVAEAWAKMAEITIADKTTYASEETATSLLQNSQAAKTTCLDPNDKASWDCDCYFHVKEKMAATGLSENTILCQGTKICDSWKASNCAQQESLLQAAEAPHSEDRETDNLIALLADSERGSAEAKVGWDCG